MSEAPTYVTQLGAVELGLFRTERAACTHFRRMRAEGSEVLRRGKDRVVRLSDLIASMRGESSSETTSAPVAPIVAPLSSGDVLARAGLRLVGGGQ